MKKYSETFINNSEVLRKARIGFEFEFFMKDLSYYKTMELLNQYLSPVKVWGFRQYHSDFTPDSQNFKIEPDLSGGANMVELVTGPMEYFEAKFHLVKILKFIQENGFTNEKSSIHFNLSFLDEADKDLNDLNVLKLILTTDEDEIYRVFPSRKDNVYAKTVKKIIPFKEYDFNNIGVDIVKNNLRLPNDKYYGINFLHINNPKETQRLEFRYIGGKDYEKNIGQILFFLDRFIIDVHNSIDVGFTDNDINELEKYLDLNISNFKNLSKYDNFIVDFPTISLQIDQNYNYDIVNAYYDRVFDKLHDLIDSTDSLKDCIINYVTSTQKIEIIDANVKSTQNMKSFDFINCIISDGIFEQCNFINTQISNCQIVKSKLHGCDVNKTKVLNCQVEASELKDCFFMNGYLNGDMYGGVFRSGKLGPYANISSETKIVTDSDNFFDTSFDDDQYDSKKDQGVIKAFKK
jgi:hypothetical protein